MTTRTFHDRTGKRFAVLNLTAPAAPGSPDCISFSLELDTDFGPKYLGGGDLSAADTITLLKVMQDGTGTFRGTPINDYDNHLTVGAAGGLVTFTVSDRTLTRTIRKMSVPATEAREAWRDLKVSLAGQFDTTPEPLTATEIIRASSGGDAGVRKFATKMLDHVPTKPKPVAVPEPPQAEPVKAEPVSDRTAELEARVAELEGENRRLREMNAFLMQYAPR